MATRSTLRRRIADEFDSSDKRTGDEPGKTFEAVRLLNAPDAPDSRLPAVLTRLIVQRIHVDGWFLVGMGSANCRQHCASLPAGQMVSSRSSWTVSRRPRRPTTGFAASVPKNVPSPGIANEHSSYSPIRPAPAWKAAARTASWSDSGVKTTILN